MSATRPRRSGWATFPAAEEEYLRRIVDQTGLRLTPERIHDLGQKRVAEIDERMRAVRERLGFKGSREEFQASLRKDPRFIAKSPQDMSSAISLTPSAWSRIWRGISLDSPGRRMELRGWHRRRKPPVTYGYYQPPTLANPMGIYNYNASQLEKRSLLPAAHLIYRELVPGHHFHLALQQENSTAHPLREFLLWSVQRGLGRVCGESR